MNRLSVALRRLWHVHPPVVLTVKATRTECLRAIALAARPDVDRLHLRNLFTDGRRYYLDPGKSGFRLTSNSKVPWRRRVRTPIAAVLNVEFSDAGEGATRLLLRARMRLLYLGDALLIPGFVSSLLIFAPWPRPLIAVLILTLFTLSWLAHRLTATLQATEMVYFVQKALEDIAPVEVPLLGTGGEAEVITQDREFRQQWEKFYEEHKREAESDEG